MKTTKQSGYTVIELSIAGFVLSVIVGGVLVSVAQMVGSARTSSSKTALHAMGRRALTRIQDDLQQSGFFAQEIPGWIGSAVRFPHLFENGEAESPFNLHDHEPTNPPLWAEGVNREIVFRIPADEDGDGQPDLNLDNTATWGDEQISYVCVPAVSGGNQLERRVDGVTDRVVARFVDRVVFDDAITSGGDIPLNAIRVTVDLAKTDHTGVVHRHTAEAVFRLRNGGIVQL